MSCRRIAARKRSPRVLVGMVLTCAALSCAAGTAQARVEAGPAAPRVQAAALEDSLATVVCGILKRPFTRAVDEMISLLSRRRFRGGTLASALAYEIGFKPWCSNAYGRLHEVLRGAGRGDAAVKPDIGPFVFNVRATFARSSLPGNDHATVRWNAFTLSSGMRGYYLAYSLNGRAYQPVRGGNSLLVDHDDIVRFALRIDSYADVSSPWVYSPVYRP